MKVYVVTYANWEDTTVHRTLDGAKVALQDALDLNGGEVTAVCERMLTSMDRGNYGSIDFGWFQDGEQGTIEICELEE